MMINVGNGHPKTFDWFKEDWITDMHCRRIRQ
jgi:hypothetical protein